MRDELDSAGEQALAERVARLLPFHWTLPNPLAASLSRLTRHLGGDAGLLTWLDGHPGRPRLTARLYRAIGLLDQVSAEPPVVAAPSELRTRDPYPPGLEAHLVPRTSRETLASLSHAIESFLGEPPHRRGRRARGRHVGGAAPDRAVRVRTRSAPGVPLT